MDNGSQRLTSGLPSMKEARYYSCVSLRWWEGDPMLKPEQAQKILEEQRVKDSEQYEITAIAGLPAPLRPIAYGLIWRDAEGQPVKYDDRQRWNELPQQTFTRLAALEAADRLRIFAVFFPQLAPAIELGWQRLS